MEVKSKLTLEEQIQVLENIDWREMMEDRFGLCGGIRRALLKVTGIQVDLLSKLKQYVPIFRRENALSFKASEWDIFWWETTNYGYIQRKKFVSWMIEDLKLQIVKRKSRKKQVKFLKDFLYILIIFGILFALTVFMIYFKK